MTEPWAPYIQLGINHHLLFPASFESTSVHLQSLHEVVSYEQFEIVDMFIPAEASEDMKAQEDELILASGKRVVYNCPLMIDREHNPHSPDRHIRDRTLKEAQNHVDHAKRLRSCKMVVASGADPGEGRRDEQKEYFVDYLTQLCAYSGQELEILIEPFDRSIGKNLMIGSSVEAAAIVDRVKGQGFDQIGLMADMGHIPLMGESFAHALQVCSSYMRHVHLGSCVMNNPANPLYGDMHPPWGYPDGENDVPELAEFLQELFRTGYLGKGKRPTMTLEMRQYPDKSEKESVALFLLKLREAWEMLTL